MFSFVDVPDQTMDLLKARGGIYCTSIYTEHKFINKHLLLPETVYFVIIQSNDIHEKSYLFDVEVGRCGENISRITVMNCKECKEVCINIISKDSQNINHQTVPLPVVVYINRQKNFIAVYQECDEEDEIALICSTSIKADGVYTCTIKCEWCRKLCFFKRRYSLMLKCQFRTWWMDSTFNVFFIVSAYSHLWIQNQSI